ncbi:DUF6557 family protein [Marinifilum fragile]|uniref:DUF6557 family protein n=1 Tax=Marinifilum fragile TaxID=570161 RepID=UPI002AAB3747|nr:DUF6557 family protein [Marinifilum fragile]
MRLKELIEKHYWQEVQPILLSLYSDQDRNIKSYRLVFEKIKNLQVEESNHEILIRNITESGETYVHVNAISLSEKEIDGELMTYSLILTPWNEWAGMSINAESLSTFPEKEIIVHCLWEMTFCGFDEEDVKKVSDEINDDCKNLGK